jgi:hypothetical protein
MKPTLQGLRSILDLVLAHTAHRHPFNLLHPHEDSPWYAQPVKFCPERT